MILGPGIFVIAKIGGRYRCVGAISIGFATVDAFLPCASIIKTFEAPANRIALEHELRWATTLTESDWASKDETYLPFPFIHNCLASGLYRAEGWVWRDGSSEPMPRDFSDRGMNDTRYAMLDITELSSVRYCFTIRKITYNFPPSPPSAPHRPSRASTSMPASFSHLESDAHSSQISDQDLDQDLDLDSDQASDEDSHQASDQASSQEGRSDITTTVPISPPWWTATMEPLPILRHIEETDCCGYDPDDELGDRAKFVKMFKDVPLIEAAALNEVWPGQWQEAKLQSVERLVVNQTSEKGHDFKPASSGASSLLAMSLEKVILETLLEAPEALPRIFKHIRGFSGFWPALKEKLYSMPHLVTNSKTVGVLLRKVLKNESTIDLSPFDLNGDQLHRIVCNGAKKKSIHILSLSGNQNLREADVKDILNKNKSLEALHLLNTPQIPLQAKLKLSNSVVLLDSELLAEPFITTTYEGVPPKSFPLSYIHPTVGQMTFIMCGTKPRELRRLRGGGIDIEQLDMCGTKISFKKDVTQFSTSLPLESSNLPAYEMLFKLGRYTSRIPDSSWQSICLSQDYRARRLALQFSIPHFHDKAVTTIPAHLYRADYTRNVAFTEWKEHRYSRNPTSRPREIRADDWSFVLIYETVAMPKHWRRDNCRALRYAFVSLKQPFEPEQANASSATLTTGEEFPNVMVVGIEELLQHAYADKINDAARECLARHWHKWLAVDPENPKQEIEQSSRAEIVSWLRSNDFTDEQRRTFGGAGYEKDDEGVEGRRKSRRLMKLASIVPQKRKN